MTALDDRGVDPIGEPRVTTGPIMGSTKVYREIDTPEGLTLRVPRRRVELSNGSHFDLYFPFPLAEQTNRWGNTMAMIGRLKPGVTPQAAHAEVRSIASQLTAENAGRRNTFQGNVKPLADQVLFGELVNGGTVTVAVVGVGPDARLELIAAPPRPAKPKAIPGPKSAARKPKAEEKN